MGRVGAGVQPAAALLQQQMVQQQQQQQQQAVAAQRQQALAQQQQQLGEWGPWVCSRGRGVLAGAIIVSSLHVGVRAGCQ
jgi:hypothetical protein